MNTKNLKTYVLTHNHEYGETVYMFHYESTEKLPYPDLEKVIDELDINFEPEEHESVYLEPFNSHDLPTLIAANVGSSRETTAIDYDNEDQEEDQAKEAQGQ